MLSGPLPLFLHPRCSTLNPTSCFPFCFFSLKIEYVHHFPPGDSKHNCPSCIMLPVISPVTQPISLSLQFLLYCRLVVTFILETWIHMPVGSHYFSWWYWRSIITYAYGHYFSGAINMCCDLGALDLTSHTCLLLAEACFKSVTSVFSPD